MSKRKGNIYFHGKNKRKLVFCFKNNKLTVLHLSLTTRDHQRKNNVHT